jgi:hypothetical protein
MRNTFFKGLKFTLLFPILTLGCTTVSHYFKTITVDSEIKELEEKNSKIIDNFSIFTSYKLKKNENNNKTIVILHDIEETTAIYDNFFKNKEIENSIFLYDRPGYGLSEESKAPRNLKNLSLELHSLVSKLDLKNLIIISKGNSCYISEKFTQLYPDLVIQQIKLNPSKSFENFKEDFYFIKNNIYTKHGVMELIQKFNTNFNNRLKDLDPEIKKRFFYHIRTNFWEASLNETKGIRNSLKDLNILNTSTIVIIDDNIDSFFIQDSENVKKVLLKINEKI